MDTDKGRSVVKANVPLAEMLRYTTILRSMTGGKLLRWNSAIMRWFRTTLQEIIDAKSVK